MSTELVMPSNHLILCHFLLLLPSIFPCLRVFSNELSLHIRWPKYWTSTSASVLSVNIQGWRPLGLTGWISLLSKGLSRVFSSTAWKEWTYISGKIQLDHGVSFLQIVEFSLLIFCWGFLHLYTSEVMVCIFFFSSVTDLPGKFDYPGVKVMVASEWICECFFFSFPE